MKKIISAAIASAMAASMSVPAFAILTPDGEPVIQGDIMLLSGAEEVVTDSEGNNVPPVILPGQSAQTPEYLKNEIIVTAVENAVFKDAVFEDGLVTYDGGSVRLTGTKILDINGDEKSTADINVGDILILFDNAFKDTDIPDYAVIMSEENPIGVTVDRFSVSETLGEYVDSQNFLAINVSDDTEIVDIDGNALAKDDIADKYLMVFYSAMTMSIPAITNPSKIIVLGSDEPEEPEYSYEIQVDWNDIIYQDNAAYIPVRKYAESLGFEVTWNGEDKSVTVGTIPMGVSFKIGENSYTKARMTPFVLDGAPELINDTTYVPVSFFEQVLEAKADILELESVE